MPEGSVCYTLCFWLTSRVLILLAAEARANHTGPHHITVKGHSSTAQNYSPIQKNEMIECDATIPFQKNMKQRPSECFPYLGA